MKSSSEYTLVRFEAGTNGKKVTAILKNKKTGNESKMPFGQKGSSTYQDKTGKGHDSKHGDSKIRAAYRARHQGEGDPSRKYSPGWFAWHYLW